MSAVALQGDVQATGGAVPFPPATVTTSWVPGPITYTLAKYIQVDGVAAVVKATCTFAFTGLNVLVPVSGTSTVSLEPQAPTFLNDDGDDLLKNGDVAVDSYGNTLQAVVTQQKLYTG